MADSADATRLGDEHSCSMSSGYKESQESHEIATLVMRCGLHCTKDVPTEAFGARGQLKVARHPALLEVFSDTAFGAATKCWGIQGLAIFFGGCAIAWQASCSPAIRRRASFLATATATL